jgi:hypothetical protein
MALAQAAPPASPEPAPTLDPNPSEIPGLVEALRDDTVRRNAMGALYRLPQAGAAAIPLLERALLSDDEQQRSLAACTLVAIGGHAETAVLAQALLDILTPPPGERFRQISARPWVYAAGRAGIDETRSAFLALEADAQLFAFVQHELVARVYSDDPVLRFDAARIVLAHPHAYGRPAAIATLVEHLADNDLRDDAAIAMRILGRLGFEALPAVYAALPGSDRQAAQLLAHLLAYVDPTHPGAHRLTPRELSRMGFPRGDMLAAR